MENDDGVEGIKDCFVKEMSVRIGERAREKSPSSDICFPSCPILYAGCCSETKPYFVQMMARR
jgi:hypothetical protein